jgi:hypothetical protein
MVSERDASSEPGLVDTEGSAGRADSVVARVSAEAPTASPAVSTAQTRPALKLDRRRSPSRAWAPMREVGLK